MFLLILFLIINVAAFALYGLDKYYARREKTRIPESRLLWAAALFGAVGAWIGMRVWHHKTLHKKFRYGVPALFAMQVVLVVTILYAISSFFLNVSLKPEGRAERYAKSMEYLADYPGVAEWTNDMLDTGALRDTFIINDDNRLHALYASHPEAKGTVLLSHGYTDNALRMMMLGHRYYTSLHFNIIVPDHVCHGQSDGDAIQMGWLDRLNVERWIDVANQLWPDTDIFLHGISMGAATVMMCSGDELPDNVRGIIEDCGYTSVWDEFANRLQEEYSLSEHPILDAASIHCKLRYGWSFGEASALKQVEKSTLPILFIHGDSDTYVPTEMVYPLYEAKTQGFKKLWIAPGSAHARAFHDHPSEYMKQVSDFISKARATNR